MAMATWWWDEKNPVQTSTMRDYDTDFCCIATILSLTVTSR
jgi:hypothetical protein